jgi:hypothetical protein
MKKFSDKSVSLVVHPNSGSSLKVGLNLLHKALLSRRQQHHSCHHESNQSHENNSFIIWKIFAMI